MTWNIPASSTLIGVAALTRGSKAEAGAIAKQTGGNQAPLENGASVHACHPCAQFTNSRVDDLEHELAISRYDLRIALENLETSDHEQKMINAEALLVKVQYQSTIEELTALNIQLQEMLERQRSTSNDFQNVLYSTDVATLFLDADLRIRFFTPATRLLFHISPADVGRPLTDLRSLSADDWLAAETRNVLNGAVPIEREIEVPGGIWYLRRILPYRPHDEQIDGVVITFTNVIEDKHAAKSLHSANREAEQASIAKSRFLAAASHDLCQPLQSLTMLQALLAQTVEGDKASKLVERLGQTLAAMTGMIDVILDINQIEAGAMQAELTDFAIANLFDRLRDEFSFQAQTERLDLRILRCGLIVKSDPRMLEQMVRNLLANAIKYTPAGRIVLGCRRLKGQVRIEIWDTGIGIAENEFHAIFNEFYQVNTAPREGSKGLGLGLAIVQRLAAVLNHDIGVRSQLGMGSVFSVVVPGAALGCAANFVEPDQAEAPIIFMVDDDAEVRGSIRDVLEADGHQVEDFPDAETFLAAYRRGSAGCLLLDAYLPGMGGIDLLGRLRATSDLMPTIVMTGKSDVAMAVTAMKAGACDFVEKPVSRAALLVTITRALDQSRSIGIARARQDLAARHVAALTPRQHQVMDFVLAGHPNKNIATDLGISQRTVENHRAAVMHKMGAKSLPELVRHALAAERKYL